MQFAVGERALAADHVAHVFGGQFVMRQVDCGVAVLSEGLRQLLVVAGTRRADADEHLRDGGIADAVVELGDVAIADQFAEALEAAALFRDRHREKRFARFADLGALGDEAQAIEVHVGAAGDRNQRLALQFLARRVRLHAGDRQRAGGLEDRPRVLAKTSLIAAQIASVSTSTISST